MTDVGSELRRADPLAREAPLSSDEVERMRRAVMAAGRTSQPRAWTTRWTFAAAMAALTIAAVAGIDRWRAGRSSTLAPGEVVDVVDSEQLSSRRQLQFATPGGTRVIWVFDSKFKP